ncbi:unnamed protein product [Cuscuta epithymum]|uniref:DUF4283 domain-containing protein n=1 Tax=Cuscuta epithymum TaxID=186058 RepID=A0AAV0FI68_9ASTE|nr:unnamed protein product [Cuscuta epithymum]
MASGSVVAIDLPFSGTLAPVPQAEAKTWKTLFKDNRDPKHGFKLRYVPPKGETLDFGDRELPTMVDMWGYCLVGHFTGSFPGLKAVHDLKATWGVKCLVRSHKKGWLIFKFQSEEDRSKVLREGPYTVFGKLLMLKELSENFSFEDEEFLKVPIWVKFHDLPMQLWNDEAMSEVASMVGVPITTDKITKERINNDYARVLIEVDASKPPPLSFPIRLPSHKVFKQSVVYETFPSYCFHCKEFGHHPFICNKLANRDDEGNNGKGKQVVDCIENNEKIGKPTVSSVLPAVPAQPVNQTGCPIGPTGSQMMTAQQKPKLPAKLIGSQLNPTGSKPNPTGLLRQNASGATTGDAPHIQGSSDSNENSEAILEETERIVTNEKEMHQYDVVVKCEVINDKTLKLFVKPFRFVQASVIRVDTSLRLTDDLDRKGLTFTAKCFEGLPGVTKKKGEVCFDSKFTTPFRSFFGC